MVAGLLLLLGRGKEGRREGGGRWEVKEGRERGGGGGGGGDEWSQGEEMRVLGTVNHM